MTDKKKPESKSLTVNIGKTGEFYHCPLTFQYIIALEKLVQTYDDYYRNTPALDGNLAHNLNQVYLEMERIQDKFYGRK